MLLFLALIGLVAPATPPSPAVQFVGHAARICLLTKADPTVVKRLAETERWTPIDPASAPGESPTYILDGKLFTRTHAWQLQKRGATYWVGLFDVPGQPRVRDCSFMAWDLEFEAVDAVLSGNRPPSDPNARKVPARMYKFAQGTLMHSWSGIGSRRLETISVTPKP